ncbi:UvrD-helicase domain-containing protein [Candidatus Sumerlaeota bacterium]|nr:UvrD-helicase domain-containing protein [Candidatus Sumerlaeota bacterium]
MTINIHRWQRLAEKLARRSTLNQEQCRALMSTHSVSVVAAAGSGKTRVLITRYLLHLLAEDTLKPNRIVAITFTENASAEMRKRIREFIDVLLKDAEFQDYHLRLSEIQLWLSLAQINTIHSFCQSILSEYPLEVELAPGFAIIEQTAQHIHFTELVEMVLREINEQAIEGLSADDCLFLARHLSRKRVGEILLKILQHRLKLAEAIQRAEMLSIEVVVRQRATKDKVDPAIEHRITQLVARVVKNALQKYSEQKSQEIVLDFDDLLSKCAFLLKENNEIRTTLAEKFRYFLIDEFQDTNPVQWEIVRALSSDGDGALQPGKIFIVGDPKQSIYGFRDADVRIFNTACQEIAHQTQNQPEQNTTQILMNKNYRARRCLIDFTNFVFSRVMAKSEEPALPTYEVEYQPLEYALQEKDTFPGRVEFLLEVIHKGKATNEQNNEYIQQAELVARWIKQIVAGENAKRQYDYKDIAILLRWTTHLLELESTLRSHNIPYVTLGGIGFYRRQEIWDVYNMLSFLVNQDDDISLVGVLRSPFFAFSDNLLLKVTQKCGKEKSFWERLNTFEKSLPEPTLSPDEEYAVHFAVSTLNELIEKAGQTDVVSLIEEILERTGYLISLMSMRNGKYMVSNIEKMLGIAQGSDSLAEFVMKLNLFIEQKVRESEAQPELTEENAVKIMTIHCAKGLEFPVVILPFLNQKLSTPQRDIAYIDRELFAGFRVRNPANKMKYEETSFLRLIRSRAQELTFAEEKRLLYVGVTRAKDWLVLCSSLESKETEMSRDKIKAPFDWLSQALGLTGDALHQGKITFSTDGREWEIPIHTHIEPLEVVAESGAEQIEEPRITREQIEQCLSPVSSELKEIHINVTDIEQLTKEPEQVRERKLHPDKEMLREKLLTEPNRQRDIALLRGTLVHNCLELGMVNPQLDVQKVVMNELRKHHELSEPEQNALAESVFSLVQNAFENETLRSVRDKKEKYVELPFQFSLSENIIISGKIDLLWQGEDGVWQILDYKTDPKTQIGDSVKDYADRNYRMQVLCYAMFLQKAFPSQEKYPTAIYFIEPNEMVEYTFTDTYIEQESRELAERISKMFNLR